MKKTWDEIIESDVEYIDLIGFGSIIHPDGQEGDIDDVDTVIVYGWKRIYNLKMVPEDISDEKLEEFRKKYWEKYGVCSLEDVKELGKENVCMLNTQETHNTHDHLNGVLIRIYRQDFETYKKREEIYDLFEVEYYYIDPSNDHVSHNNHKGYILSAREKYIIPDGYAFMPYHTYAREGAYSYGECFGKMFDQTTFRVEKRK